MAERNLQASSRDEKVPLRKELWQMKTAVERSINELVGMMLDSEYGCLDNSLANALGNKVDGKVSKRRQRNLRALERLGDGNESGIMDFPS